MKKKADRLIILISLIAIIVLFTFFLKDIMVPFIRMEINRDLEGAKELLVSRGVLGFFAVTLIEALQMVVIFIPAEFIQISSGLSYPFYIALLLCDLGVCLGATIIFVLVRTFRFENKAYSKNKKKIEEISSHSKKEKSTVLLLYFLFFMPLIPFGAICYYGSSTNIRYRKYILTVATGVIPSIITSNLMGAAAKAFVMNSLPIPLLVLIIAVLATVLFVVIFLFLDKIYFKENDKTPDSILYTAFFKVVTFFRGKRQKITVENDKMQDVKKPYIMLCNHESYSDFYYINLVDPDNNAAYVVNKYYATLPVIRKLAPKAGVITKMLFTPDIRTARGVMSAAHNGYPVIVFPEGRLSVDGASYPILDRGAGLYKKTGADIVLVKISGAYFSHPKWRKRSYHSNVSVRVERVIKAEEAAAMTADELDDAISKTLYNDASEDLICTYPQKNKAKGLEKILYRCKDCGALYSLKGTGNDLVCSVCGKTMRLNDKYRFEDGVTIHEYYKRILDMERAELDGLHLSAEVRTKIFDGSGKVRKRERGICTLDKNVFTYRSGSAEFSIGMDKLPAIPFSCGDEFELYYKNELYYFYPETEQNQVVRWAAAADILIEERINEK